MIFNIAIIERGDNPEGAAVLLIIMIFIITITITITIIIIIMIIKLLYYAIIFI